MDFGSLDLRHFRLVRAVVDEGSLTAAAARLALSQPALSHQLRDIEDRLGLALFERRGRSLVLTEAGGRVLDSARAVLDEVERAEADLTALASGQVGTLRVAAECFTTYHWLPEVVRAFGIGYPDVRVELAVEATERPREALLARALDVALLTLTADLSDDLALMPLFEDEVVAVVAEDHAWAGLSHVEPAAFEGEHLLTYQSCQERDCVLGLVASAGAAPARITPVPLSTEAAVGVVRAGQGMTTMARWAAKPYLDRGGLVAVSITPSGVHRMWYAATRNESRPAYLDAFVDVLTRIDASNGTVRAIGEAETV